MKVWSALVAILLGLSFGQVAQIHAAEFLSGKAHGLGRPAGGLSLRGVISIEGDIDLGSPDTLVNVPAVLRNLDDGSELLDGLPVTLFPHPGNNSSTGIFRTAPGVLPNVTMKLRHRQGTLYTVLFDVLGTIASPATQERCEKNLKIVLAWVTSVVKTGGSGGPPATGSANLNWEGCAKKVMKTPPSRPASTPPPNVRLAVNCSDFDCVCSNNAVTFGLENQGTDTAAVKATVEFHLKQECRDANDCNEDQNGVPGACASAGPSVFPVCATSPIAAQIGVGRLGPSDTLELPGGTSTEVTLTGPVPEACFSLGCHATSILSTSFPALDITDSFSCP